MDAKALRKQIRNVLQEVGKEIVTSEVGEAVTREVNAQMNARLDQIDKYCQSALEKQDKRARGIQSFLIGEVKGKISEDLFNANVTIDAVVAVLAESGIVIEGFSEKVDAKKKELAEARVKQASEQMQADMKARSEAIKSESPRVGELSQQEPVAQPTT